MQLFFANGLKKFFSIFYDSSISHIIKYYRGLKKALSFFIRAMSLYLLHNGIKTALISQKRQVAAFLTFALSQSVK